MVNACFFISMICVTEAKVPEILAVRIIRTYTSMSGFRVSGVMVKCHEIANSIPWICFIEYSSLDHSYKIKIA